MRDTRIVFRYRLSIYEQQKSLRKCFARTVSPPKYIFSCYISPLSIRHDLGNRSVILLPRDRPPNYVDILAGSLLSKNPLVHVKPIRATIKFLSKITCFSQNGNEKLAEFYATVAADVSSRTTFSSLYLLRECDDYSGTLIQQPSPVQPFDIPPPSGEYPFHERTRIVYRFPQTRSGIKRAVRRYLLDDSVLRLRVCEK